MIHFIWYHLGLSGGNSPWYLFLSGICGIGIIGSGIWHNSYVNLRKHNCHEPRCWRIGHVVVDDKGTLSCWHHHPAGRPKPGHIARAHKQYQDKLAQDKAAA